MLSCTSRRPSDDGDGGRSPRSIIDTTASAVASSVASAHFSILRPSAITNGISAVRPRYPTSASAEMTSWYRRAITRARSHTPGSIDRAGSTLPTIFALFTLLFDDLEGLCDLFDVDGEDFPFVDREADRGEPFAAEVVMRSCDTVEPVSCFQELAPQLPERDRTGHDDASPDKAQTREQRRKNHGACQAQAIRTPQIDASEPHPRPP
jgi:hypothetical protein